MTYRKVQKGEPMYKFIQASKKAGQWICDSYDHNADEGCSNPECFKHPKSVTVSFPDLEEKK